MGGAMTGDGEGTEGKNEGDQHPPHVRSPIFSAVVASMYISYSFIFVY